MTKDVLISIKGLQFQPLADGEKIEVITGGNYYKKRNKHYLMYEEVGEDAGNVTKNLVKFDDKTFSLTKSGSANVNMVFEENKRNITNYITPFGSLVIGIDASNVDIKESDEEINIRINYALDINYEHFADCEILMDVRAKSRNSENLLS